MDGFIGTDINAMRLGPIRAITAAVTMAGELANLQSFGVPHNRREKEQKE